VPLPASSDPALGRVTFDELRTAFGEQARGLIEGGADVLERCTARQMAFQGSLPGGPNGMTLTGRWNYHNELGAQFPIAPLRVVYPKSGSQPAACLLRDLGKNFICRLFGVPGPHQIEDAKFHRPFLCFAVSVSVAAIT